MLVIVDHNKNMNRIAEVLKADSEVFDVKSKVKASKIEVYDREGDVVNAARPYIYVTIDNSPQQSKYNFGITNKDARNQIVIKYKIVCVARGESQLSKASQEVIYNMLKNTRTALESDPTFKDPVLNNDPIFTASAINDEIPDESFKKEMHKVTSLILLGVIGSEFTIEIPTIGLIPLLSQPNNSEGILFQENKVQNQSVFNRVITESGDFGSLFVEYESTESLDSSLRDKIFAGDEEQITLNTDSSNERLLVVKYIEINPTIQFDGIRRSILHMEIKTH